MSYAQLDYPPEKLREFDRTKITMECNNDIERTMRISACAKEPWTVAVIETMAPGEIFWDVGANVGSYTLLATARRLQVVAFEPVAENYATLCRNLALNQMLESVIALPIALGDEDALIWVHLSDMRSGAASHVLSGSPRKQSLHKQPIPLLTAATAAQLWELPLPHVLKIDVDGFELEVLQGAEFLLAESRLRNILLELHIKNDAARIQWLADRGWTIAEQFPERGGVYYALFTRAIPGPAPNDGDPDEPTAIPSGDGDAIK